MRTHQPLGRTDALGTMIVSVEIPPGFISRPNPNPNPRFKSDGKPMGKPTPEDIAGVWAEFDDSTPKKKPDPPA